MPSIRDRDEGYARRRDRLAMLKKGPGTFIYNGNAKDVESVPTPKLTGRDTPALDDGGMPILDAAGRQVFQPAGRHALNEDGSVILGGVPKLIHHPIEVFKIRGYEFSSGKPTNVNDASLALKLRGMDCFEEVEPGARAKNDVETTNEDDGPTRSEMMSMASAKGLKPERTATKADLQAMLKAAEA
jgi:hypothetical protein